MARKSKNNRLFFIYTLIFCLVINVAVNYLVRYISHNDLLPPNNILRIIFVHNTGAAFSILDSRIPFLVAIGVLALCCIVYKIFISKKNLSKITVFGFALLAAGAIHNMYERINLGHVVDYIDLQFIHFAVFNMADVFITIGAIILIYQILVKKL